MPRFIVLLSIFAFMLPLVFGNERVVDAATIDVSVLANNNFSPSSVTINSGDTVRWIVLGSDGQIGSDNHPSHENYIDPQCPASGCWDSPLLFTSDTYSFTFRIPGTWGYHNHQVPGKTGTVVVNDLNAPATVTNLSASNPATNSVTLSWTSPGEDVGATANFGTPTTYDIRYATTTITDVTWASATQVSGEPSPKAVGGSESTVISGLLANTTYYFALKTSDEIPNTSVLSNVVSLATTVSSSSSGGGRVTPDSIPPRTITDFFVSSTTSSSADLIWSAPGDDAEIGTAATYDIRYATSTISDTTWASAIQVTGEPAPIGNGLIQSMKVSGLAADTTYYFAIKALDEAGNSSIISNMVTAMTGSEGKTQEGLVPITDLFTLNPTVSSIDLYWTVPQTGNDTGALFIYDIRYSIATITDATWASTTRVMEEPLFIESGLIQSMKVSGLSSNTTYYFAMTYVREGEVTPPLSNIVTITTLSFFDVFRFTEEEESEVREEIVIREFNDGDLIRELGDTKAFIVTGGKRLWIPTPEAFTGASYRWSDITDVPPSEFSHVDQARLLRVSGRQEVYSTAGILRRHIINPEAFVEEGLMWGDIIDVREFQMAWYTESRLLRVAGDTRVYRIDGSLKRWVTTEKIFADLGFEWNTIFDVAPAVLERYATGDHL